MGVGGYIEYNANCNNIPALVDERTQISHLDVATDALASALNPMMNGVYRPNSKRNHPLSHFHRGWQKFKFNGAEIARYMGWLTLVLID